MIGFLLKLLAGFVGFWLTWGLLVVWRESVVATVCQSLRQRVESVAAYISWQRQPVTGKDPPPLSLRDLVTIIFAPSVLLLVVLMPAIGLATFLWQLGYNDAYRQAILTSRWAKTSCWVGGGMIPMVVTWYYFAAPPAYEETRQILSTLFTLLRESGAWCIGMLRRLVKSS